ncbi:MAG: C4-dicarboxylate ABC transporter, partial [Brevundimonas sp.]
MRQRRSPTRLILVSLAVALLVVLVLASALYLNRRAAARQVLVGWLDQRGIKADVEVETLEMNGFVGRIRIGDPARPDVMVERVEVDYAIAGPWATGGLAVTPSRIRLLRPVVRATWAGGKLSLGSLDPLIDEFTGRPPQPDSRSPLVIVEGGRLNLTTEYGPVQVLADARVDNGKLIRLHAVMPAAALKSGDTAADGFGGALDLTTRGDRVAASLDIGARSLRAGGVAGRSLRLKATGDLPYPDLKTHKGDGRAVVNLTLDGDRVDLGDSGARGVDLRLAFDGQTSGWIDSFA